MDVQSGQVVAWGKKVDRSQQTMDHQQMWLAHDFLTAYTALMLSAKRRNSERVGRRC
jgi:hypothetical protein